MSSTGIEHLNMDELLSRQAKAEKKKKTLGAKQRLKFEAMKREATKRKVAVARMKQEEGMKFQPEKTLDKADKELQKVGEEKPKEEKMTHLEWIGKRPIKKLGEDPKVFGKRLREWRKSEPKLK